MARDSSQFFVGGVTDVYVAPVGTAMPADETTSLNAAFVNLGFTTDDGVGFNVSYDTATRNSSQALDPTLRIRTGRDTTVTVGLQQFNQTTLPLALGGGTVTVSTTHTSYSAPDPEDIDYRALITHSVYGGKVLRICIPKVMVTETGDISFAKEEESVLDLTFGAIASSAAAPWTLLGNTDLLAVAA